ncbi:MAG: surface lipoprotein assembly modifier [Alphaproteobacteria bacterium]|nr:surface lipoprotein assembly modifier [Alphaproteobacteria bacterium]
MRVVLYAGVAVLLATTPAGAEQHLTESELLAVADNMAAHGDLDAAQQIYSAMSHSASADMRTESQFQLGNIAMARGDYSAAISAYRAIVDANPNLPRVRLELARAYFMDGDFQAAQFHFEFVRATPGLPAAVRENIDRYLTLIRMRKNWSLDFGFGIVPDSNINNAGTENEECINTIFGPLCRPLETRKHGVGLRLNTDGNYYLRLTRRLGIRTTAGVNVLGFQGGDFDDYSLYLATGPRYVFDSGEISLQPVAVARWYAGDFYNYSYGLRLDTNWQIGRRWLLGGGASMHRNQYHTDYINDALRGYDWGVSLQPRYYLNNKSFVLAGLRFGQEDTHVQAYGNDSLTYSVGYFGEFRYGFAVLARLDLTSIKYHAPRYFVIDNAFEQKTRHDTVWSVYVRLSNNKLNWHNLIPAVSYTYTRRDSNVPTSEFDKHRVEIEIMRRF